MQYKKNIKKNPAGKKLDTVPYSLRISSHMTAPTENGGENRLKKDEFLPLIVMLF